MGFTVWEESADIWRSGKIHIGSKIVSPRYLSPQSPRNLSRNHRAWEISRKGILFSPSEGLANSNDILLGIKSVAFQKAIMAIIHTGTFHCRILPTAWWCGGQDITPGRDLPDHLWLGLEASFLLLRWKEINKHAGNHWPSEAVSFVMT